MLRLRDDACLTAFKRKHQALAETEQEVWVLFIFFLFTALHECVSQLGPHKEEEINKNTTLDKKHFYSLYTYTVLHNICCE